VRIQFLSNMSYVLICYRPVIASEFSALDQISWIASAYFLTRTSSPHLVRAKTANIPQKPPFYSFTAPYSPSSIENTSSTHPFSMSRIVLSSHLVFPSLQHRFSVLVRSWLPVLRRSTQRQIPHLWSSRRRNGRCREYVLFLLPHRLTFIESKQSSSVSCPSSERSRV
jgi:hypothetical protein